MRDQHTFIENIRTFARILGGRTVLDLKTVLLKVYIYSVAENRVLNHCLNMHLSSTFLSSIKVCSSQASLPVQTHP